MPPIDSVATLEDALQLMGLTSLADTARAAAACARLDLDNGQLTLFLTFVGSLSPAQAREFRRLIREEHHESIPTDRTRLDAIFARTIAGLMEGDPRSNCGPIDADFLRDLNPEEAGM